MRILAEYLKIYLNQLPISDTKNVRLIKKKSTP